MTSLVITCTDSLYVDYKTPKTLITLKDRIIQILQKLKFCYFPTLEQNSYILF